VRTNPAHEIAMLVYEELRRLAAARMSSQPGAQTLRATALVHGAWLRLVAEGDRTWQNRAQFFAAAAEAIRRILTDRARRKHALKSGAGRERIDTRKPPRGSSPSCSCWRCPSRSKPNSLTRPITALDADDLRQMEMALPGAP
jgi:RNA polymerase sigma factor (TIGR02999 family)